MQVVGNAALVELAAAGATVLAAWQLAPQVAKLRRSSAHAGLSPTWAALGVVTNLAWVVYRWSQGLWFGVPSPIVAAVLYVLTLLLLGRGLCDIRLGLGVAVAAGAGLIVLGASAGSAAVGLALGLSGGAQSAPSVWAAYRVTIPSGIAPSVWVMGVGQAAMWGYYGSAVGDQALAFYGLTMGTASLAVLARYALTRHLVTPPRRFVRSANDAADW